jgi:putative molybdopterin biosynthesis protein
MAACEGAGWRCSADSEQVEVRDGLGRVSATPVRARWPVPRFSCAAMDGIAIRAGAADLQGTGQPARAARLPVRTDRWRLPSAAFVQVDTGDPLPADLDTVVERERVEFDREGNAWITGPAPRGRHVRASGEDFRADQLLIPAGHRLRPIDLAAAAAAGHAVLPVVRPPVVAIIPTGDEIRAVGSPLGPGDITDSNSVMLAAQAAEAGARPLIFDVQPDDPVALGAAIRRAAGSADAVLVIAGSSGGRSDHTGSVLASVGGVAVRGVAVRPGHPALLGYARSTDDPDGRPVTTVPVIGVPGYPLAAVVIFELFAVPLIAALQGVPPADRIRQRVRLACDWTSSPDVEDWVPVMLAPPSTDEAGPAVRLATPKRRGASSLSRLVGANAWWPVPIGEGNFARGEYIDVQPIPGAPPAVAASSLAATARSRTAQQVRAASASRAPAAGA